MTDPRELPQQVAELIELAKQYLRQETIDPMRRLGVSVAVAVAATVLVSLGAVLGSLALHRFLIESLPETRWWGVAAAGITSVVFLGAALVVGRAARSRG
ncbi:MAG: phage holin family protein [bacterium]|nr:phage holin family protein [bacterium]MDE0234060.1 phage holin family protein [bacterium]